jgi:hypothetical protein
MRREAGECRGVGSQTVRRRKMLWTLNRKRLLGKENWLMC